MSFQGSASAAFELYPLRFQQATPRVQGWSANTLRGAFGAVLKRRDPDAYSRYFAPTTPRGTGPSGFANPPRPFVFRLGAEGVGLNLFTTREPAIDLFVDVIGELGFEVVGTPGLLHLSLAPSQKPISRVRVRFLTPTELGEAKDQGPEFGILASRIRDRISTLRVFYGPGPLDIDFKAFGDCAAQIRMTRCEVKHVEAERVSKRTGQRHSLGGFTGFAEYEGALTAFVPYLEAACYTGVGRQTVWGKGEIAVEEV